MRKIRLTKSRVTGILTIVVGLLVMGVFLGELYARSAVDEQYNNSLDKLEMAAAKLSDNQTEAQENEKIFDEFSIGRASILSYYLDQNPAETDLSWFVTQCHVEEYYLFDAQGNMVDHSGHAWDKNEAEMKTLLSARMPVMIGAVKYYYSTLKNGGSLIVGRTYTDEYNDLLKIESPEYSLGSIVVGETGYIAEVSLSDDTILYAKNTAEIGKKSTEIGLDSTVLSDGYSGKIEINGKYNYVVTKRIDNNMLIAVVPWSEIQSNYSDIELLNILLVSITMIFLLIYAELIRKEMAQTKPSPDDYKQIGKHLYLNKKIMSRMKNVVVMGIIIVFIMTYYLHTLSPLSHQGIKNEIKVDAVSEILDVNEQRIQSLKDQYTKEYTERAQNISYLLYKDPALVSNEAFSEIASRGGIEAVYLFDENGHVTTSNKAYLNYTLSTNEVDDSYQFWDVINGYQPVVAQISGDGDSYEQFIGVSLQNSLGMLEIKLNSTVMAERLKTTQLSYVLSHIAVINKGTMVAVNAETQNFDYISEEKLIGHSAAEYGMKSEAFTDGYEGFQTIAGTKYMMNGILRGDDYIYCAVPLASIYSSRISSTLWTTVICGLIMFAITMMLVLNKEPDEAEIQAEVDEENAHKKDGNAAFFKHNTIDGTKRLVQSATSRYETHISWDDKTSEQKLYSVIGWTIILLAILIVINTMTIDPNETHSVLAYVLSQKWEKGINIFSLTFVLLTMLEVVVVTWAVRKTILLVLRKFGARSETIGRLLDSFLKYAAVIGGIFYCLGAMGLDSMSLLASASILGLMLSFGAQSLIGDILAGIFIVFEGEFRVGDIVTIGDWRGTVVEIGIRTTKVLSGGHDVKIFNNSEIKQVINMTKQYSTAVIDVGIDYNESLERVEAVLKKELPHIREHVPAIIEGPYYKGVTSLGDSSVNIRILAECHEKDRIQVVRDMNREIKLCFDRNHISIPYPQIVVNQPAQTTEATNEDKMNANKFLHEQKEASKNLTETHED